MTDNTNIPQDENQIIAERRGKLGKLREQGQPFPNDFRRENLAAELHEKYDASTKEQLEAAALANEKVKAAVGNLTIRKVVVVRNKLVNIVAA